MLYACVVSVLAFLLYERFFELPKAEKPDSEKKAEEWRVGISSPQTMDFCNESVPLHEPEVRERFEKELYLNVYRHSETALIIKRANRWFPVFEKVFKEKGIPDDFKYLAVIESNLENLKSYMGALGYWQIMPVTGKELGLEVSEQVDERLDPVRSTYAACRYLQDAKNRLNNWTLVAASYNMGVAGVQQSLASQKANSYYDLHLNPETARYVYRILALKEIMKNPKKYSFDIPQKELYSRQNTRFVSVNQTVINLVDYAKQHGLSYKLLKYYNPWLKTYRLDVSSKKTYTIQIPVNLKDTLEANNPPASLP
ncbi:MAG: lytic transglycosylase domain-containing protein [Cytophagales bacterium]|nr:MAG: lytic transglycosylase domain-containing protein [Cytophagales bacterium]TAF60802.1 MAG: lytic transglycosylase domain-containing protein [Cytophagales bacterium]